MQTIDTYNVTLGTCIGLQGPPGCGKTTLACMFPNVYVADCDMNLRGTIRFLRENKMPLPIGFDTIDVDGTGKEIAPDMRYKRLAAKLKVAAASPDVETLVIDSATKIGEYMLAYVLKQNGKDSMADMNHKLWGDNLYLWRKFIGDLRATGKTIIIPVHEAPEKDPISGAIKYMLHIPGSIKHEFGHLVSDVWRCEVVESGGKYTWMVRTMPNQQYQLKNTFGMKAIVEANGPSIKAAVESLKKIRQQEAEEVAKLQARTSEVPSPEKVEVGA